MNSAKEIISGILCEKSKMHTCIDVHNSFDISVTAWTACFRKASKLTIEFQIMDVP